MPISVKCPECDAPYKVPDEAAGKAIKCKKCGAKISVPAGDAGGGNDFAGIGSGGGDDGGETKAKKKGGAGKILMIVGGLLAVSCCICGGGGSALFYFYVYKPGVEAAKKISEEIEKAAKNIDKNAFKDGFKDGGGKGVVASGLTILEKKETLTDKDPKVANGKPAKAYKVKLEAGKEYIIDMRANVPGPGQDPYLILLDPGNKEVARDDDSGGGLDAQIRFTPAATGEYTVQATCLFAVAAGGLPFNLTVKLK